MKITNVNSSFPFSFTWFLFSFSPHSLLFHHLAVFSSAPSWLNCNDFAIISTCVKSKNKPSTIYDDDINNFTQALNGKGLSFSRETLKEELHKYFKYVCVPYYLPNDPSQFDLTWPTTRKGFHRQILFATNDKKFIDESKFSYELLNEYKFLI